MNLGQGISCVVLIGSSLATMGQQPVPSHDQSPDAVPTRGAQDRTVTSTSTTPPNPPAPQPTQGLRSGAPAQTIPSASSALATVDNATYIIGADDALQITVWREPTLSGTFPVRPDGKISMVLLGDLPAAGITPTQLSADIGQRLRKFVQEPIVTVQVMAVDSQRIYMIGEVGHVGPIGLSAAMTPLQAIATAGGLSPFANSKHIYILRGTGATQQKIPFNYKQALKGDDRQGIVLRPGDTIVVP